MKKRRQVGVRVGTRFCGSHSRAGQIQDVVELPRVVKRVQQVYRSLDKDRDVGGHEAHPSLVVLKVGRAVRVGHGVLHLADLRDFGGNKRSAYTTPCARRTRPPLFKRVTECGTCFLATHLHEPRSPQWGRLFGRAIKEEPTIREPLNLRESRLKSIHRMESRQKRHSRYDVHHCPHTR